MIPFSKNYTKKFQVRIIIFFFQDWIDTYEDDCLFDVRRGKYFLKSKAKPPYTTVLMKLLYELKNQRLDARFLKKIYSIS